MVSIVVLAAVVVVAARAAGRRPTAHGPQVVWLGALAEALGIVLVADRLAALMLLVRPW